MKSLIKYFRFLGLIVVVLVASMMFIQFSYFSKKLADETERVTTLSRDNMRSEITGILLRKGQIISDAAEYVRFQKWETKELTDYFKLLIEKDTSFSMIYLGTPSNEIISSSRWVPGKDFDLRNRPWYQKAIAEKGLVLTKAYADASKDELIITIAEPVYNSNGELLGVVAGDVSIRSIISLVQKKVTNDGSYSFLIDGDGSILAHPLYTYNSVDDLRNIYEISKEAGESLTQSESVIKRITLDGEEGYLAHASIENTDWKISWFTSIDNYMKTKIQLTRIFSGTLLSAMVVLLILFVIRRKHLVEPLIRIDRDISEINIEKDITYRLSENKDDPFLIIRKSINAILDKTQDFLGQLEAHEEELIAANEELEASLHQLAAAEEELWSKNISLMASEQTFRTIFEGSSDAILIMKGYEFIDCNPVTLEMFGFSSKDSVIGKTPWELSPEFQPDGESSREKVPKIIEEALKNEKHRFEWWHRKKDGAPLPVEVMLTPIELHGEKVFHVLWRDISERKQLEQRLEYLSYHDQLTGLYNRRFFVEELSRLDVKRNYPLTILMADVNGLKLINDSFGHDRGDELLMKTAEAIKKGCREDDIVSRIGGDEFIILLPRTDGADAEKIMKRIQENCTGEKVASIEISISFGWESKLSEEQDINEVLKKAENYLYKRKLFESPSMRGKTVNAIISTLHEKNKREEQHSYRVSILCNSMGKALGLPESDIKELKTMGLLHDIGKIAIDENILNKPGKLTKEEYDEIKKHPEIGYRILSSVNDMSEMAEYVLAHHERWDGKGYPRGLKGEEIPLKARIITIADAYDAMISARPYRSSIAPVIAIQELRKNSGTQFDPGLVEKFIEIL